MSASSEVLDELREAGPLTVRQVAENIGMPAATVHRALKGLQVDGLVVSDNYQLKARVFLAVEREGD